MRLAAIVSLFLLASLNIKCDSGAYDRAIDAINYDKASHDALPPVGKNEQLLLLKSTSAAPEIKRDFDKNETTSSIAINTKGSTLQTTVKNNSQAAQQTSEKKQTGKQAQSLSMADARIDIVVIVPPKDNHVTNVVRERIANNLNGVLTGSGVLAGSNWRVIVINSSYNGEDAQVVRSISTNPLSDLKKKLIAAGSAARRGSKFYNPVPLTRMGTAKRDNLRANTHAKIFLIVADRDLICATGNKASPFVHGCIVTPIIWAQNKANENFEIYGLLRPDHSICGEIGCTPAANTGCYDGSVTDSTRIKRNAKGCYNDKGQPFTLSHNAGLVFCGDRGGVINPCHSKGDSHKRYLGSWLSLCSQMDSSCYRTDSRGYFIPNAGQFHLFTMATTYDNSDFMISNVIAGGLKSKISGIRTQPVPFDAYYDLDYTEKQVVEVRVAYEKNGNPTQLPQSAFTTTYPGGKLRVTVRDPQTNFPEGSTLLVTVTLADPVTAYVVNSPSGHYMPSKSVVAKVDNAPVGFSLSGTTVTLNNNPRVGANVVIEATHIQASYSVAEEKDRTDDPVVCSKQGGQPVDCAYDKGTLLFTNPAQLIDANTNTVVDSIMVTQKLKSGASKSIELIEGVIIESANLTVDGSDSSCDAESLAIVGTAINIEESYESCEILKPLQSGSNTIVTVTYDTVSNNTEYELRVPADMLLKGSWNVRVKINGEEKKQGTDYVIDKRTKILTWLELEAIEHNTRAVVEFY